MDGIKPDAILTEEEKTACKEAFDAFDKFGYGTLEVEELQKVLEGK
jgi:Ca2+-binding EF-hand superfamily protein